MVRAQAFATRRVLVSAALFGLALNLSACSGGSRASTVAPPTAMSSAQALKTAQATITVTVPARVATAGSRAPKYVSPSAQSITINSYQVNAGVIAGSPFSTATQNLTSSTPGCVATNGGMACGVTIAVPVGTVAFEIFVYQGLGGAGSLLSYIAQSTATEATIAEGSSNVVLPLILGGVPANIVLAATASSFTAPTAGTATITALAYDAGGNLIVGGAPYATPITLTNSDGSGTTSFSTPSITAPGGSVTLAYNGGDFTSPSTVSATSGSATANAVHFTELAGALSIACTSACTSLANGPTPYSENISEPGYQSGTFTLSGSGTQCTFDPPTSVTASNGSATVNVYPSPNGGTCTLQVTDSSSRSQSATMSFVAAGAPSIVGSCSATFPKPTDPNPGTLYVYSCSSGAVRYGAYTWVALDSTYNPCSFQIAGYANGNQAALTQFTTGTGNCNRYITGVSISGPNAIFTGQGGTTSISYATQLLPP
jgi:hypothetical protein